MTEPSTSNWGQIGVRLASGLRPLLLPLRLTRELSRRPFLRNVATLASGTAIAQVITMAFSPVITRLFGPEAYGLQGVFTSVGSILATVAAFTYPTAIVLPKSDDDAMALVRLSIYVGIAMSGLSVLVLSHFGPDLLALLNAGQIQHFIYLLPFFMMVSVINAVTSNWAIRRQAFTLTARVAIASNFLFGALKVGVGLVYPTAKSLIIANTLSGLIAAAMTAIGLSRGNCPAAKPKAKAPKATKTPWQLAKDHCDFALFRTPQNLLNVISHSLPVMMLSSYFGSEAVGHYAIASAVLAMPAGLIGQSVTQVFYPRITKAVNEGQDARALIVKATSGLAVVGAIPFVLVIVFGPDLFAFAFGADWERAGIYAQWLSLWLFFQYINKPAVSAIPALRIQRGLLIYELFSTASKVLALYLGYSIFRSDTSAIALFSIVGVIAYSWLIIWVIVRSRAATIRHFIDRSTP